MSWGQALAAGRRHLHQGPRATTTATSSPMPRIGFCRTAARRPVRRWCPPRLATGRSSRRLVLVPDNNPRGGGRYYERWMRRQRRHSDPPCASGAGILPVDQPDPVLALARVGLVSIVTAMPDQPAPAPMSRTRTGCGDSKSVSEFVPIAGTRHYYGRCRACRARRERERYHGSPRARAAKLASSARSRRRRSPGEPTSGGAPGPTPARVLKLVVDDNSRRVSLFFLR